MAAASQRFELLPQKFCPNNKKGGSFLQKEHFPSNRLLCIETCLHVRIFNIEQFIGHLIKMRACT